MSLNKYNNRKRLIKWTDEISSIIKKIIITLVILLVCSQAALQNNSVRLWLTGVDQWEGTRLN
ncbi:hypothetical protein BK133_10740 [Paenibacillus sp. FSL H8-0548]|uniref:hypothetical protein n=1 Tax=Paenibacillus sp. FSL H8-0548 TaxID=1920422 RepID=UPI00096F3CC6|nr:hypothetical protein [Paenibacillus sp. FSL H8-0548]OMF35183.1 hypothetical protein BK133_10740 [Paenibacillus sp. FSL H8-0548]